MIRRRDCPACQKQVIADHVAPNHAMHFLLSLLTAGTWILPWLLITLFADDYPCPWCSGKTKQPSESAARTRILLDSRNRPANGSPPRINLRVELG